MHEGVTVGLVEAAREGDARAFEVLLRPLLEPGYRLACGMLHDPAAAEDSVQAAAFKAWRRRTRLREGAEMRSWFLGIVANECRTVRRSRWWSVIKSIVPAEASETSPADLLTGMEVRNPVTFTLKVTASPGSYHYRCALHPKMEGDIIVKAAGAPLPSTDAQYQAAVQPIIRHDLKVAGEIAEEMKDAAEDAIDIGGTGTEVVDGGGNGVSTVLRFVPQTIKVGVGRKVTFVNRDQYEPHTVTFGAEQPSLLPYGDPSNVSDPAQQVSSGILASKLALDFLGWPQPPFQENLQYSFTFTKPGVYPYICTIHDEVDMVGQVVVTAEDQDQ